MEVLVWILLIRRFWEGFLKIVMFKLGCIDNLFYLGDKEESIYLFVVWKFMNNIILRV